MIVCDACGTVLQCDCTRLGTGTQRIDEIERLRAALEGALVAMSSVPVTVELAAAKRRARAVLTSRPI